MEVTLVGTGCPVPTTNRAGSSVLVQINETRILFDCGPGTVQTLVECGIRPDSIDKLFISHNHIDHTGDLYNFIILNWYKGDEPLSIYGPQPITDQLLQSMYDLYEEDITYRISAGGSEKQIRDISTHAVLEGKEFTTDEWRIDCFEVEHSIETYGFRIYDDQTDSTVVISGDSRKIPKLEQTSKNADLLIQDCGIARTGEYSTESDAVLWPEYSTSLPIDSEDRISQTHCTPRECGEIASQAEVDTLVLTHLLPYRDEEKMKDIASEYFSGNIEVAEDGIKFTI